MNIRGIGVLLLALVVGGSAATGMALFLNREEPKPPAPDKVTVVVASGKLIRGQKLAKADLATKPWMEAYLPPDAATDLDALVGRLVSRPIGADEPILESKLAPKGAGGGLAPIVTPNKRAFTIHTPNVASGVGGFLQPGDRVDVVLTVSPLVVTSDDMRGLATATTLLQNIEVLAVDQFTESQPENKIDPGKLRSVTLLVEPDQATKLSLGQNQGTLYLSLRNPGDNDEASTRPITLRDLRLFQDLALGGEGGGLGGLTSRSAETEPEPPAAPKATSVVIRTLRGRESSNVVIRQE